jgi:hypothetical protein
VRAPQTGTGCAGCLQRTLRAWSLKHSSVNVDAANLNGANLGGADCEEGCFIEATLQGTKLRTAQLKCDPLRGHLSCTKAGLSWDRLGKASIGLRPGWSWPRQQASLGCWIAIRSVTAWGRRAVHASRGCAGLRT